MRGLAASNARNRDTSDAIRVRIARHARNRIDLLFSLRVGNNQRLFGFVAAADARNRDTRDAFIGDVALRQAVLANWADLRIWLRHSDGASGGGGVVCPRCSL